MALDLTSKTPAPPPARKRAASRPSGKTVEREEAINGIFQIGASGLLMFGQTADAGAISIHGPAIAHETAVLADNNTGLAKIVDYITAVGPYAALFAASMPLVLQILVNHKKLPAAPLSQFGVMEPNVMAAKAEVEAMRQQEIMLREVEAAQKALAEQHRRASMAAQEAERLAKETVPA